MASYAYELLSPQDAAFLAAEGPSTPMHIGAVFLADAAPVRNAFGGIDGIPDELAGWGGDHYVAWSDGDRTCVRVAVLGDTIQDTDEYEELLTDLAADPPGGVEATATRGEGERDPVIYTSCG